MKVKFKKLNPNAVLPTYAKIGDAALDLTAVSKDATAHYEQMGTGLAVEIPDNHLGLLFPRSSITNKGVFLGNAVGVIDSKFRGEITFRFKKVHDQRTYSEPSYNIGDRIGQLLIIPYPTIEPEFADSLSNTERGSGGYGSSGK